MDEEPRKLTTINTTKGLFCFNRFPFGVSAAPEIFQCTMENLLQGIPHVCIYMYLDDIVDICDADAAYLQNLSEVL